MRGMSQSVVKTRFAPSPTGHIHLGNVRTALFNVLLARAHAGVFLLRIEDTDQARSRTSHRLDLQEDLRWLGLDWQEGPEAGGDAGPYLQSERGDVYAAYYDRLIEAGLAYPCFCTDQALKLTRKSQLAAGQPPRYPGTCARLSADEVQAKYDQGLQPTLRFRVPRAVQVAFEDLVRGPQRYQSEDIGDFIIRRSDGTPAFFFTNAVDDALMGVTHVLRGEDHITNTPRQLMLLEALGLPRPTYGHISLIVGPDGAPLSKRHGSHSVRKLRAQGYLPLAIANHLARLGHRYEAGELLDWDALAQGFDCTRLGKAPARHDDAQLDHWQKEAVARGADRALWDWLCEHEYAEGPIQDQVPADKALAFVATVRDNISMPGEAFTWAVHLFHSHRPKSDEALAVLLEAGAEFFAAALDCLPERADDFKAYAKAVGASAGVKGKALFMPLRAALTGQVHGPEMTRVFTLLGIDEVRERLNIAKGL